MVTLPKPLSATAVGALVAIASLFAFLVGPPPPAQAVASPSQEQLNRAQMIADVFDEHNRQRRANGLAPFEFSPAISLRVSQPFTNGLATNNDGIWHNSGTNISKGGGTWGENVASGPKTESATSLVGRWMNSPGHRKNILNPVYTTIAIGIAHADEGRQAYSTVNLYKSPINPGPTYATGAQWLAALKSGDSSVNVYLTPGTHHVNGRDWRTACEPYSQTKRCTTDIWASQASVVDGQFVTKSGWFFNNLTYAPSARSIWKDNPLGAYGMVEGKAAWTVDGRKWRTECDTAATGRGGCRSYVTATVVERVGSSYRTVTREVFNNLVLFS